MPYLDYSYLDPLHIVWRKGTPEDPYTLRSEFIKVVNQTIILSEIPDKVYRVRITGYTEVNHETFSNRVLSEKEFYVNYSTGVLQFNSKAEAVTLNPVYKGRGFIQYPADRIYYQDKFNNVVYSLKDIIDNTKKQTDTIDFKFNELEGVLERAEVAIDNTEKAIDDVGKATEDAVVAKDLALDAYKTTRLVFKDYVNTFNDIAIKYPSPQVGWTTFVYKTGERFRYDGIRWVAIDAIGGAIPVATETSDGLQSKEHFIKVRDLSEFTDVKIMTFVVPEDILDGVQAPKLTFSLDGEILSVEAYVGEKGVEDLPVDVEVSVDYENWSSILDFPILIEGGNYEDNKLHKILNKRVLSENKYRITVNTLTADARDLQVIIKAKID